MAIQDQINRITNEVGTQSDLIEQIKSALQGKAGSGGSGIIDVTELPTEGIDENAVYRVTARIEGSPPDIWIVMPDEIVSLRAMYEAEGGAIYCYIVSDLPADMKPTDVENDIFYVYILEESGIAYINLPDFGGVVPISLIIFGEEGYDKGWTDDPYSIDLSNPESYGMYASRPSEEDFVRWYIRKASEWEELSAHINYKGTSKSLSGEYPTDDTIEVKQASATVDVAKHIIEKKNIPNIVVNVPFIGDLINRTIENVPLAAFNEEEWRIGKYAFHDCTNLTTVELPNSITSIDYNAFENCTQLQLDELPSNIQHIENDAFAGCKSISLTELPPNLDAVNTRSFSGCENLALTKLPDTIRRIYNDAFYDCKNIVVKEIPDSVDKIQEGAFQGCISLTEMSIGNNVHWVMNYAFSGCSNLRTVTFKPANHTKKMDIASDVFWGCSSLTTINVPWSEGEVTGAPWGASNATINYNYTGE